MAAGVVNGVVAGVAGGAAAGVAAEPAAGAVYQSLRTIQSYIRSCSIP